MRPRTFVSLVCLVMLLAAPLAGAQDGSIAIDVNVVKGGEPVDQANPGTLLSLVGNVTLPERDNTTWRVYLNGSVGGQPLESAQQLSNSGGQIDVLRQFNAPNTTGNVTVSYTLTVQSKSTEDPNETAGNQTTSGNQTSDGNGTSDSNQTSQQQVNATWQTEAVQPGELSLLVATPEAPEPGLPTGIIVGGVLLVVLVVGGVVAYARWPRQYSHDAGPRSQALQDLEDGGSGGGTSTSVVQKEPEVHPQVKILEARASDVRRMIELAQERHERGDITEHQFNMIREKKEAELQEIEEEITRYRSGEAGS